MIRSSLEKMKGGWFIGDFQPAVHQTTHFEVAVKKYKAGEAEPQHVHRIATECTVIISGTVQMAGEVWEAGDIVVLEPGESSSFLAITDAELAVVKFPSIQGDKYLD